MDLLPRAFSERSARIGIAIDAALEIAQQKVVTVPADNGIGCELYFSAAAGGIDHEDRRRITRRVAAQRLQNLKPGVHAGPEMGRSANRVALIEVVGLYAS